MRPLQVLSSIKLKAMPFTGAVVDYHNYRFEVVDMDGVRIDQVLMMERPDRALRLMSFHLFELLFVFHIFLQPGDPARRKYASQIHGFCNHEIPLATSPVLLCRHGL